MRAAVVVAAVIAAAGSGALGRPAGAQEATCSVVQRPSNSLYNYRLPSGQYNQFWGGGAITMRCPSRGITLVADSLEQYGDDRRVYMLGNVSYSEPRLALKSDYLTYYLADERVVASGSVLATLPSGSTLRGPQAEYRRAVPRVRTVAELDAIGRPTVTIVQKPAAGASRPAGDGNTTVTANTLRMRGDSLLYAAGGVDMARRDFGASSDSMFMNTATEYMRLMRNPAIDGRTGRPFRLTGTIIDLYSRDRQLARVLARGEARARSDEFTLAADTIEFRIANDLLQAAFAWGPSRQAEAVSESQRITADSIAVTMPAQRVRSMSALGDAYAEARPDTVAFRTLEMDWLRGDTIVARFDTVDASPPDSGRSRIRELIAFVGARSYQHMPPRDTSLRCPAISYVRGDSLRAVFDDGKVRSVDVVKASEVSGGIIAEPDSTCRAAVAEPAVSDPQARAAPGRPEGQDRPAPSTPDAPVSTAPLPARVRPQPTRP